MTRAAAMLIVLSFAANIAQAQSREDEARALAEQGRLAEARALLVAELSEAPSASVAFNLALIEHSTGDFEEAESLFGRLLGGEFGELPDERRTRTSELMARSGAELATLVLHWRGESEGTLRIDGRPRGALVPGETLRLRLNPISHAISLRADGVETAREVHLERGQTRELVLGGAPGPIGSGAVEPGDGNVQEEGRGADPLETTQERPLRRSPWLWITLGLVVAGGVTAAVLLTRDDEGGNDMPLPEGYLGRVDF